MILQMVKDRMKVYTKQVNMKGMAWMSCLIIVSKYIKLVNFKDRNSCQMEKI